MSMKEELPNFIRSHEEPLVLMGVGLPGVQKSKHLRPLANLSDFPALYVSSPMVRSSILRAEENAFEGLTRSMASAKVRRQLHRTAAEHLLDGNGVSVVVDDVNNNVERRREDVTMYRNEFGAKAVLAVLFTADTDLTYQLLSMRNSSPLPRERFDKLAKMIENNPPCIDDGFDEVAIIDTTAEIEVELARRGQN